MREWLSRIVQNDNTCTYKKMRRRWWDKLDTLQLSFLDVKHALWTNWHIHWKKKNKKHTNKSTIPIIFQCYNKETNTYLKKFYILLLPLSAHTFIQKISVHSKANIQICSMIDYENSKRFHVILLNRNY